jgi:hypothetical protein
MAGNTIIPHLFTGTDAILNLGDHASTPQALEDESGSVVQDLLLRRSIALILFLLLTAGLGIRRYTSGELQGIHLSR